MKVIGTPGGVRPAGGRGREIFLDSGEIHSIRSCVLISSVLKIS